MIPTIPVLTRQQRRRLERIYADLPAVACKGLCQRHCTSISFYRAEAAHLLASGITLPMIDSHADPCSALDRWSGRCRIYTHRPMICRIWGVASGLRCPHGCRPEREMSRSDAQMAAGKIAAITGDSPIDLIRSCSDFPPNLSDAVREVGHRVIDEGTAIEAVRP